MGPKTYWLAVAKEGEYGLAKTVRFHHLGSLEKVQRESNDVIVLLHLSRDDVDGKRKSLHHHCHLVWLLMVDVMRCDVLLVRCCCCIFVYNLDMHTKSERGS